MTLKTDRMYKTGHRIPANDNAREPSAVLVPDAARGKGIECNIC